MFQATMGAAGICLGIPDVCLTPTPVGPVPIPYPNIALNSTANPATAVMSLISRRDASAQPDVQNTHEQRR
jgi:hypothetical protein